MKTILTPTDVVLKFLYFSGIISAIITLGTDIIVGSVKQGYRFDSQSISLLSAYGSSTRAYVLPLNLTASLFLLLFSTGIYFSGIQNFAQKLTAILLAVSTILNILAIIFFPLHPNVSFQEKPNKINVILMGISVLLFFVAIIVSSVAYNNWFRFFSIGLLLLFLIVDVGATMGTKPTFGGSPGPLVGIQERTMVYGEMLWLVIYAVMLF